MKDQLKPESIEVLNRLFNDIIKPRELKSELERITDVIVLQQAKIMSLSFSNGENIEIQTRFDSYQALNYLSLLKEILNLINTIETDNFPKDRLSELAYNLGVILK